MNLIAIKEFFKPLLDFLNGLLDLFLRIDSWWKGKTRFTKNQIRWIVIASLLTAYIIYQKVEFNNASNITYNRNVADRNILQTEVNELRQWKFSSLEKKIEELEALKEKAKKTESELETLKSQK